MGNTGNQIDVALVATRDGDVDAPISGDGADNLPRNSGAYHSSSRLTDNTGQSAVLPLGRGRSCSSLPASLRREFATDAARHDNQTQCITSGSIVHRQ